MSKFYEGTDGNYYVRAPSGQILKIPRDMLKQVRNGLEQGLNGSNPNIKGKECSLKLEACGFGDHEYTNFRLNNNTLSWDEARELLNNIDSYATQKAMKLRLVEEGLDDLIS